MSSADVDLVVHMVSVKMEATCFGAWASREDVVG